jgi:dihydrolipoamide dehydrogenase
MKLLVLGGGPAGLNAALQARELGAEVALIDRKMIGGTSLNEGPAPVRTLARAAINANRVEDYAHSIVRISDRVRSIGIELVEDAGPARFLDPHTVTLPDGRRWSADRIVIAVGGHPGRLSIPGAELALTYTDIRTLAALPKRVAIVGGADTACQLGSILVDFGCEVLLIESAPRLNPRADADISDGLATAFAKRGIEIATSASVQRLVRTDGGIEVRYHLNGGEQIHIANAVFFAVGWPASVEGLNLDAAGVVTERGFIKVNDSLQSNLPHIFAAGDANGRSMLVPSARYEGRLAAENALLGARRFVAHDVVPTGSFTDPEYGSVGLTEAQARERYDCAVAVARYDSLARPVIDARAEGFCKLIAERKRRYILGAHVLGEYSAEVIQVAAVAMAANMRVEQLADLQLAFPTFTEALGVAAQMLARELGVARAPVV